MKNCTLKQARHMYLKYNRRYFRNKLPRDAKFYWASTCPFLTKKGQQIFNRKTYAQTDFWEGTEGNRLLITLTFSDLLKKHLCLLAMAVLHEMIHVQLDSGTHGPKFKRRKRQLMRMGAYDKWT